MDAALEFTITRQGEKYKIICEGKDRKGLFQIDPSTKFKLHKIQEAVSRQISLDEEFVEELGKKLFDMLFSDYKDLLHASMDQFDHLTIVLHMNDPFLNEIPWELCYDPQRKIYLGADSSCSLIRRDQKNIQHFTKIEYPLKVLVIIASPMDLEGEENLTPDPDIVVKVMDPVRQLERKGKATIDFLERASVSHIQDKLKEGYHIVHFVGHGLYDKTTEKGYLIIEDKNRNAKHLEGRGVAQLFGITPPQLVVLTACRSSPLVPFLLSRKIPSVLAMQYTVAKGVAYQFMDRLYSLLVRGDSLMHAVSHARNAVQLEEGVGCTGWFTPVLYMRAENILQIDTESPVMLPEKHERHDIMLDLLGVENFVGRRKDLWAVEKALLEDNLKMVVITGITGIGKTALASKFAHRHKTAFKGVFAEKVVDPEMGVEELLRSLDGFFTEYDDYKLHEVIRETDLEVKLVRLNECLKDTYLIVLDNFEILLENGKIADRTMEQFMRAFLSGDHSSKIIITSQYQFTFQDEKAEGLLKYVDLKELLLHETMHLLEKLEIKGYGMRRWVFKKIGGNPQSLELFVRLAKSRGVNRLLRDVTPLTEKMGQWFLDELMGLLTEDEHEVLEKMSAFRKRADRSILNVLQIPDESMDKLVYYSLVKVEHGFYFMHQGIRQYVYNLLSDDEKRKAHEEAVHYYEMLFFRGKGDFHDILEYYYHLYQSLQYEKAGKLTIGIFERFMRQGSWRTLKKLLETTVRTTEGTTKAAALQNLGVVCWYSGQIEIAETFYRKSLDIAKSLDDERGVARSLYYLGTIHQTREQYKKAQTFYRKSLDIAKSLDDERGVARSLHQLGMIHQIREQYKEAETFYRKSLDIARSLNDDQGIAASLHQLGMIHEEYKEHEKAERLYRASLAIAEDLRDRQGIAASLHQLGMIHETWGEQEEAGDLYRKALVISKRLGDKDAIAASLHQLGILHEKWGEYSEAEKLHRESLEIKRELKDSKGIAASLYQLGMIHQIREQYKEAQTFYRKSLDIAEKSKNIPGIALSLHKLGMIHQVREEYKEAMRLYIDAFKISLKVDPLYAEAVVKNLQRVKQIIGEEQFADYWKTITGKDVPEFIKAPYNQLDNFIMCMLYIVELSGEDISRKIRELRESFKSIIERYVS